MADIKRVKARKLNKGILFDNKIDSYEKDNVENKEELKNSISENKNKRKKVKSRKIKMAYTAKEEQKMDKQIETEDNVSVLVMVIILVLCFIVGISLGYILYRIAINSSSAMFIVKYLFS